MSKKNEKRIGIQVSDLFASTQTVNQRHPIDEIPQKKERGRPKELENTVKTTVTFLSSQIIWLDKLCTKIREDTGSVIDRGAIIRATLSALEECNFDFENINSEEQIREILCIKLKSNRQALGR